MNNYSSFFQELRDHLIVSGENEKALIVSFNYDTILEQSLTKAFTYTFNSIDDYIQFQNRKFILLKPHGSWNWVKNFNPELLSALGIERNKPLVSISKLLYEKQFSLGKIIPNVEDDITVLTNPPTSHYYYPELLIPYRLKDSFVMPDDHLAMLEHYLGQVQKNFILGWKGAEEKFKTLLKKKLENKRVSVIYATANDNTVENELKDVLKLATFNEFSLYRDSKGTFTELNSFIQEYPDNIFKQFLGH